MRVPVYCLCFVLLLFVSNLMAQSGLPDTVRSVPEEVSKESGSVRQKTESRDLSARPYSAILPSRILSRDSSTRTLVPLEQSSVRTKPEKKKSVDEILDEFILKLEEVDRIKKRAREYRFHRYRDPIPSGISRKVYVPLDRAEITVRCSAHYQTVIKLPSPVELADISIGDKDRFRVQIYEGRYLIIYPMRPFKATNLAVFLNGGERVLHFLLEENENRGSVDYLVEVLLPPSSPPGVSEFIRWFTQGPSSEERKGYGLSVRSVGRALGKCCAVRKKILVRRPVRLTGYLIKPRRRGESIFVGEIQPLGRVLYHGNLGNGYFVVYEGKGGEVFCDGSTKRMP